MCLTMAGAGHAALLMKFELEQMLDLLVAWEEIDSYQYDLGQGNFVPVVVKSEMMSHQNWVGKRDL